MFMFLTVVQALIAAVLVGVILMQKSEGGGLGTGGSPSGFMSARGAADFLTRTTQVLAGLFVALSIVLAALAVKMGGVQTVDTSLNRPASPAPAAPADSPPPPAPAAQPSPAGGSAPAGPPPAAPANSLDPLANVLKK